MLFDQVSKATSGTVARLLNVRISVPISKLIVDTGISPNMVTFFMVLCPGLLGAYLATQPDSYLRLACAGFLWQLASILDGCDGEIARAKLAETKFGAWFDTVTDNLAYLCGYAALMAGMWHLYPDNYLPIYAGISAIASMVLALGLLYSYAVKTGTGSLQYYLSDLTNKVPDGEKDWSYRFLERTGFVVKRDFLSLVIAIGLVANQLAVVYWLLVGLIHIAALGVLTTHYRLLGQPARRRATNRLASGTGCQPGGCRVRALQISMVAFSFLLLGYLVGQLGVDEVLHHLDAIKWMFPLLLLPSCAWHLSNTIAWNFAFPPDAFKPRLLTLFAAKLAGEGGQSTHAVGQSRRRAGQGLLAHSPDARPARHGLSGR